MNFVLNLSSKADDEGRHFLPVMLLFHFLASMQEFNSKAMISSCLNPFGLFA